MGAVAGNDKKNAIDGNATALTRRDLLALTALGVAAGAAGSAKAAAIPAGQLNWGVHVSLAPTWFDPAETPGDHHPVHGALRAARRDGEADAGEAAGAVPRRILVSRRGRARATSSSCARMRNSTMATRSPPRT